MRKLLLAGATVMLVLTGTALHAEDTADTIVIQNNGDTAPPEREPVASVNRDVKDRTPRAQPRAGEQVSLPERAPVFRSLGDAAAQGVGIRQVEAPTPTEEGWHWWQWVGLILTAGLGVLGGLLGWAWWRNR